MPVPVVGATVSADIVTIVKWALLVAGVLLIIALVLVLPFVEFLNLEEYSYALETIFSIAGNAFYFARGLINNFFLPFGRKIITGLMVWLLGKWVLTVAIRISTWVFHFIFK